jgi:hypothetical protein
MILFKNPARGLSAVAFNFYGKGAMLFLKKTAGRQNAKASPNKPGDRRVKA